MSRKCFLAVLDERTTAILPTSYKADYISLMRSTHTVADLISSVCSKLHQNENRKYEEDLPKFRTKMYFDLVVELFENKCYYYVQT